MIGRALNHFTKIGNVQQAIQVAFDGIDVSTRAAQGHTQANFRGIEATLQAMPGDLLDTPTVRSSIEELSKARGTAIDAGLASHTGRAEVLAEATRTHLATAHDALGELRLDFVPGAKRDGAVYGAAALATAVGGFLVLDQAIGSR